MGNYTIWGGGFENPRRGRQARNFTTNVPKILHLKSPSEQIFSKNCRWMPPVVFSVNFTNRKKTANLNYHMLIKKSQAILKCFIDLKFCVGLRWAQKTKPCFVTFFTSTAG